MEEKKIQVDQYKTEEVGHLVHVTAPGMSLWMNKEAYYKIVREGVKKYLDEEETNI